MKLFSFVMALAVLGCMMMPGAQAASNVYQETEVEVAYTEWGDFEIETTTVYQSMARSNAVGANRSQTVKHNGKVAAEVTLSATFGYDGKTSWVISTSGSHTTYNGWSYSNEKITKSGATATLSALLSHDTYGSNSVKISLTCSPTGQIS